jgi:hypothetical protein
VSGGPCVDVDGVTAVLLTDGWHQVSPGTLEIADFSLGTEPLLGFVFLVADEKLNNYATIEGPLTSILAVRRES